MVVSPGRTFFLALCALVLLPSAAVPAGQAIPRIMVGGIEFVAVPGGEFEMGDPLEHGYLDEWPERPVTVSPFLMASLETTVGRFREFLADTGRVFDTSPRGMYGVGAGDGRAGDAMPVAGMSHVLATAFCVWFSLRYGVLADLPTEAEWERAARGGLRGARYPLGDTIDLGQAVFAVEGVYGGPGETGIRPPNAFGLYDMAGNVWEWCRDWYGASYYRTGPSSDPRGPGDGTDRVIRGGSWLHEKSNLRVANRDFRNPARGYPDVGFRMVIRERKPRN